MVKFTSFICLFLASLLSWGQVPPRVTQSIQWYGLSTNFTVGKRVTILLDGNSRYTGKMQRMQEQVRAGVDIQLTKNLSIMPFGYSYIWNPIYGKQPAKFSNNEFRFWHQIQYKQTFKSFSLVHRFRAEDRSIQMHHLDAEGNTVDDGYVNNQTRLRYKLNAVIPFTSLGGDSPDLFLNISEEVFYSWGKKWNYYKPDQNRVYAGVGYQINKSFNVQGGVIYQMLVKASGAQQENNIGTQIQANFIFDFRKVEL